MPSPPLSWQPISLAAYERAGNAHTDGTFKETCMKLMRSAERFGLAALALTCLGGAVVTGCGGSGSGPVTATRKVTTQTRTRVSQVQTQFVRALVQSGVQTATVAAKRNGSYAN